MITRLPAGALLLTDKTAVDLVLYCVRTAATFDPSAARRRRLEAFHHRLSAELTEPGQSDSPRGWVRQDEFVTATEAAELLGVTERTARRFAARGDLESLKSGGRWLISRTAIAEHLEGRRLASGGSR